MEKDDLFITFVTQKAYSISEKEYITIYTKYGEMNFHKLWNDIAFHLPKTDYCDEIHERISIESFVFVVKLQFGYIKIPD